MTSAETSAETAQVAQTKIDEDEKTLKYHLLGPSVTKSGQDGVDQNKVGS